MRIKQLVVKNYRTLEDFTIDFTSYYSAICGKNDSGKTNVVRAIRCLMKEDNPYGGYYPVDEVTLGDDFTKWSDCDPKDRKISIEACLDIYRKQDTGLHEFIIDYLKLDDEDPIELRVHVVDSGDLDNFSVTAQGQEFDGTKAENILQRLQTTGTFLFHSSTDLRAPHRRRVRGFLRDLADDNKDKLAKAQASVNRLLQRLGKEHQEEIGDLLGRLSDKYKVGLSMPPFDLTYFPYDLTLGDRKHDVNIDEWGSGTRNRTNVLLTLFRARQVADSTASVAKVTPIIVIEEPESFLHPLAQAEFGRVLQDLAQEFELQLIVTTHSPYLLSHDQPESNILLERKLMRGQVRHTQRIDTSGDHWMEPFSRALGITDDAFLPWKDLFFSRSAAVLLVEGKTDKEYFQLLRDPIHGENRLDFQGEIYSYDGCGNLKQQTLLRFVKNQAGRVFVTFDLDAKHWVESPVKALGFENKKSYLAIGVDEPGKRAIEGLLPDRVRNEVATENPDLVAAFQGTPEEAREAKQKMKTLLLEKFKAVATPGDDYAKLYDVGRLITKALKS